METTMNNIHPDTTPAAETPQPNAASRPGRRAGRSGDDVVRWAEFRQTQWIMGFALAVIISGQGLLYSAILDVQGQIGNLQGQMGGLQGEIRGLQGETRDLRGQIGDLRGQIGDLRGQIGDLRGEMGVLRADLQAQIDDLRVDMQTQINQLRVDMQTQINELRIDMQTQFSELRERIVRIETHLGIDAGSEAPTKTPAKT